MKSKIALGARILLGLIFLVFGGMGLIMFTTGDRFIKMPAPEGVMATIMSGFMATGYLMILVKFLEVLSGIFLLTNRYVNLALLFLGAIVLNILCIHLFAEHSGLPMAIVVTVLYLIVLRDRWYAFKPLLDKK